MAGTRAIRYPIGFNGALGALAVEEDYEAYVVQLIKQVLLVAPGERMNRPRFGAGLRRLIFAPNSPGTASLAQTMVFQALSSSLDRLIRVEEVRVEAVDELLSVTVVYLVLARGERRFLNVEVPR